MLQFQREDRVMELNAKNGRLAPLLDVFGPCVNPVVFRRRPVLRTDMFESMCTASHALLLMG